MVQCVYVCLNKKVNGRRAGEHISGSSLVWFFSFLAIESEATCVQVLLWARNTDYRLEEPILHLLSGVMQGFFGYNFPNPERI